MLSVPYKLTGSRIYFVPKMDKNGKLSGLIRTIYVPSLVSVAKTNPPIFDKRWRYRVPLLHPFMSFFQCLTIINTNMCVEFHEILIMLSASKSPENNFQV